MSDPPPSETELDRFEMAVLLIGKRLFEKDPRYRVRVSLSLMVIDLDTNERVEIKTWNFEKSMDIYEEAEEGQYYLITDLVRFDRGKPNERYSDCKWEYYDDGWMIEPLTCGIPRFIEQLKCFNDIEQVDAMFESDCAKVANIYATFQWMDERPVYERDENIVGRYVDLSDRNGTRFRCLFWQNEDFDDELEYPLFDCWAGDKVLILQARFDFRHRNILHLRTLYNPVVEPDYVSQRAVHFESP